MAWNAQRYGQGWVDAAATTCGQGLEAALKEYAELEGARAVDEYEVGYRSRLELETGRCLDAIRLEGLTNG